MPQEMKDQAIHPRNKPWWARRKRDGKLFSLGMHATKEEAVKAEQEFEEIWPRASTWRGRVR